MRIPISEPVNPGSVNGDRLNKQSPNLLSGPGEALQGLGNAITNLTDKISAENKQNQSKMNDYNGRVSIEQWKTKADLSFDENLNASKPDGTDFLKNQETALLKSYAEVRKTLKDPDLIRSADLAFEGVRGQHLVKGQAAADGKLNSYVEDTTQSEVNDALATGRISTTEDYQAMFEKNIKPRILSTVKDPEKQRALIDKFGQQLAKDYITRNPQAVAQAYPEANATISTSGAKVPVGPGDSKERFRQLQFVVHELKGSESQAGTRLKRAQTLVQAVDAGLGYERPYGWRPNVSRSGAGWNHRYEAAVKVLAGKGTKEMQHARAYFESTGMTPVQASAMAGVLAGESGQHLNPGALNPKDGKDGSNSVGIAQWNAGRARALAAFQGGGPDVPEGAVLQSISTPALQGGVWNYLDAQDIASAQSRAREAQNTQTSLATAAVKLFEKDSLASFANTGTYTGTEQPLETYIAAYGEAEGRDKYMQYGQAKANAIGISKFNTMTNEEIEIELAAQKGRVPTGDGSDFAWKLYNDSVSAGDGIMTARSVKQREAERVQAKAEAATEKAANESERRIKEAKANARPGFERRLADIIQTEENTGKPQTERPSLDQFKLIYPDDGEVRFNTFNDHSKAAVQMHDLANLSDEEIMGRIQAARDAVPEGEGANQASTIAEAIAKKGEAIINSRKARKEAGEKALKERDEDPAGYAVQRSPEAALAWQSYDPSDPETARTAIALTVGKQRALGVPEDKIQPLPKGAAAKVVGVFEDERKTDEQRMNAVMGIVNMSDDDTQKRMVYNQLVSQGLPPNMEFSITAAARGDQGAAKRIATASLINKTGKDGGLPSKLDEVSRAELETTINENMMEAGSRGSVFFGLEFGEKRNYDRASRANDLIKTMAQVQLYRGGVTPTQAVENALNDIMGPIKAVEGPVGATSVSVIVPDDVDIEVFNEGLSVLGGRVKEILSGLAQSQPTDGLRPEQAAIVKSFTDTHANDILNSGSFVNNGRGFSFRDGFSGQPVLLPNGKPLTFTLEEVIEAGEKAATTKEPSPIVAPFRNPLRDGQSANEFKMEPPPQ